MQTKYSGCALITKGSMKLEGYDNHYFKAIHLTGEPLRNFCSQVTAIGLLPDEYAEALLAAR